MWIESVKDEKIVYSGNFLFKIALSHDPLKSFHVAFKQFCNIDRRDYNSKYAK